MELPSTLKKILESKLLLLVDFLHENHPNLPKDKIIHKIYKLKLMDKPVSSCPKKVKVNKATSAPTILKNLEEKKLNLKVKKNQYGNYIVEIEEPVLLVLNVTTKQIIGVEEFNGEIKPLDKNLIELCHKYKLKYSIPLNLNTSQDPEENFLNEISELGLNYVESESEVENED